MWANSQSTGNEMKTFPEDFKYKVNKQLPTLPLVKQQVFAVIINQGRFV